MIPSSQRLEDAVLDTLTHIAQMVGATLGPGGRQVLIERPEIGLKPIVTKDGVTVFKSLGYEEATKQLILEAARDAAIRTAAEAGDGTTTATILSSAIARTTAEIVRANPRFNPQKIVREMQALVPGILSEINSHRIDITGDNYETTILNVASLSANGDIELAQAILDCVNLVGEEGNLTIVEANGPSKYSIEKLHGYTVERGYEESCRNFANGFINDKSGTNITLDNPIFILFDGIITDMSQVFETLSKLGDYFQKSGRHDKGIVLVAHGFSESFLGDLHVNWTHPHSLVKVFPLLTPEKSILNWRTQFLYDLQSYTGNQVFNPMDRPLSDLDPEHLCSTNRITKVESGRFRTTVVANEDQAAIEIRIEELKLQKISPESEYEANDLDVRIGKLSSGIARLNISGPSGAETREKRDRAEDAWMAVRGALKYGACPGGGYVLVKLAARLQTEATRVKLVSPKKCAMMILGLAMLEPVKVLYRNYGYTEDEISLQLSKILNNEDQVFDVSEQTWVKKSELLDSIPAVTEAIRNSISIASLLGTVGGIVAFKRDAESDKSEEKFVRQFEASIGERGSVG